MLKDAESVKMCQDSWSVWFHHDFTFSWSLRCLFRSLRLCPLVPCQCPQAMSVYSGSQASPPIPGRVCAMFILESLGVWWSLILNNYVITCYYDNIMRERSWYMIYIYIYMIKHHGTSIRRWRERYHDIDYFAWFCMVLHGIAILLPTFCRLPADASVLQCTDGQVEIVLLDLWLQVPVGTIRPTDWR